jgi:hypothetical protein
VSIGVQGEDYTKETVGIPPERQVSLPISGGSSRTSTFSSTGFSIWNLRGFPEKGKVFLYVYKVLEV